MADLGAEAIISFINAIDAVTTPMASEINCIDKSLADENAA